ncbi:MAG: hypothetical protein DMF53_04155 [Acidobacteria bacterium]|nr:MAG: hypothetical protein DMF53_04155 [Acidobacteriota bacterium]
MRTRWSRGEPDVSVVIPVVERHGDLAQLYGEFAAELARLGLTAEFIFVVDEHLRGAVPALREIQALAEQPIDVVLLGGPFGESAALTTGFNRARAERIVTLASYFQVEPVGLGAALQALDEGADLVAGRRHPRIDSPFNRLQTRLFHGIVHQLTHTGFHDLSCGFKVMRRRVARELSLYGGLHRFIPLLALHRGFAVREIPLPQRREDCATRYFGRPPTWDGCSTSSTSSSSPGSLARRCASSGCWGPASSRSASRSISWPCSKRFSSPPASRTAPCCCSACCSWCWACRRSRWA